MTKFSVYSTVIQFLQFVSNDEFFRNSSIRLPFRKTETVDEKIGKEFVLLS